MTAPLACACGQPATLYGWCQPCWATLSVYQRGAAIKAQHPGLFKVPNRRLEWRAR